MAKADKCPYCGSKKVSKTIAGWIEEGTGAAAGAGFSALIQMVVPVNHLNTKGFRDGMPTQYKCKQCGKRFHVTSLNDKVSVWNSDTPENIAKAEAEKKAIREKLYSCTLVSIGKSKWQILNTKRLLSAYTDMSFDYVSAHLPCKILFKTTQVSDLAFRQFVHMPVVLPASCCSR